MMLGEHGASPDLGHLIPIVSQFGSLELPSKRLHTHSTFTNAPSDSFAEIMRLQLTVLCAQFEANNKATPFTSHSTQYLDFHAMCSIIDQRNIAFDGSFNIDNPIAFAAGAKNNPDILSQGQMNSRFGRCRCVQILYDVRSSTESMLTQYNLVLPLQTPP